MNRRITHWLLKRKGRGCAPPAKKGSLSPFWRGARHRGRLARVLVNCYPSKWRAEYGSELADLIGQNPLNLAVVRDVLCSALKERARQPVARALLGSGFVFLLALLFSDPLWRLVSSPVIVVPRYEGIQPPSLVALTPWEQLEVIYLGMPFLVAASIAWPCWLALAWRGFTRTARAFAACSAALYILCFLPAPSLGGTGRWARCFGSSPIFRMNKWCPSATSSTFSRLRRWA